MSVIFNFILIKDYVFVLLVCNSQWVTSNHENLNTSEQRYHLAYIKWYKETKKTVRVIKSLALRNHKTFNEIVISFPKILLMLNPKFKFLPCNRNSLQTFHITFFSFFAGGEVKNVFTHYLCLNTMTLF